ncbi:MAG: hypothetical protein LBU88_00815 [Treponema sp.]|jgi:hypothetical protein|nr:hypothetical protein [Treponema sp.]
MNNSFPLLKQVPYILRARGYRLYTQDNRRLIDLWLNGGAALLGHTPPNFLRELKNTASRGLYAPLPHFTEGRFLKALSKLLPDYYFRIYSAPPPELNADLWRPFTEKTKNPIFVPVLPGIQNWHNGLPVGLCAAASLSEEKLNSLPPDDIFPPVLLAAATRGIYDIIAAAPEREYPQLPNTYKALKADTSPWRRESIYLTLKETPSLKTWAALFDKFLQAGFLLPPTPEHPVILPGELSDGEDAKLAAILN